MVDYGRRTRRRYRNPGKSKLFLADKLSRYILFGFLGFIFFVIVLFFWYSRDLPTPEKLSSSNLSQSTKILDRNEVVLYDIYGDQNRTYVKLPEINKYIKEATIATEDADFYENQGFSIPGYLRAVKDIVLFQRITGGSTITQQLVKNTLLTSEQTIPRKIKELMLAIQVDKKYSKDEILELYLNVAPYGGTAVGVEAASERYFGKKASDLSLVESAILAGLPQSPSYYSPYNVSAPKAYVDRTKIVLKRMREEKYITKEQEKKAVEELPKVVFQDRKESDIKAPHFSLYVKQLLIDKFGEELVEIGGLKVTTTLDYEIEKEAEKIVKEEVNNARSLGVGNGASVVIDPQNGEILAMVGSKDFFATQSATSKDQNFQGQFNVITQALRQPGSSIKPVTYAVALERGYTAASLLMDTQTVFHNPGSDDYVPRNYDGKFHGPLQVRFALGSSINIPAVKMLALVGVKNMLTTANDMGIETFAPTTENVRRFGLSLTLGGGEVVPLELATSYAAFANGGYKVEPVSILKVEDRNGKKLYEYKAPSQKKRVLSEEVSFIISHILLDNNARLITFGVNSYLNMGGRQIAVKTGTTDDKKDNWTVGWTPSILVLTWVGNNDNTPMGNVASGVTGAAPIWRRITLVALAERPSGDFKKPDNVIAATVDAFSGGLPIGGQPTRSEYFIKGTEPTAPSPIYAKVKICKKDQNRLAHQENIDRNDYDTKDFIVLHEDDPVSADGVNRWQEGINAWLAENKKDDPKYHPPTETCEADKQEEATPTPTPTPTPTQI